MPTPTPTPTPTPAPDPIVNLSANATYADLVVLLPEATVECLISPLGQAAYDQLLTQQVVGDDIALRFNRLYGEDVLVVPEPLIGEEVATIPGLDLTYYDAIGGSNVLDKTLKGGLYPFIGGDAVKLLAAALVLPGAWVLVDRLKGSRPRD